MTMDRIPLRVLSLRQGTLLPHTFVLLFAEEEGRRTLPVVVNREEAALLVRALSKSVGVFGGLLDITYDLAAQYQIEVDEIILHYDKTSGYFAYLFFVRDGLLKHMRTSVANAVLLAMKFGKYIHIKRELFERRHTLETDEEKIALPLSQLNAAALEHLLDEAVRQEDYELAANVRDELMRRETSQTNVSELPL